MTIETKYNIGDEVWHLDHKEEIKCSKIKAISCHVRDKSIFPAPFTIAYFFEFQLGVKAWYFEYQLFPTKEELLKSL